MANISWTSGSINSFFNTSLGNPGSAFSGIYNSLSDSAMIKSGSYHKLMDSYYKTMKEAASDKDTDTTTKTESKKTTTVLDELLSAEKKDSVSTTYDSTGAKTQAATPTIDQSI